MKRVRVSNDAQSDLESGYRTSRSEWGAAHAAEYYADLRRAVMRLGEMPAAWPDVSDIRKGLKRMIWRSHIVYFRETETEVQVVAILHGRRDAASALADRA